MWIDEERVIAVIEKLVTQRTGRDDQMIEAAACQGRIAALLEDGQMRGKQGMQIGMLGIHGNSWRRGSIVPRLCPCCDPPTCPKCCPGVRRFGQLQRIHRSMWPDHRRFRQWLACAARTCLNARLEAGVPQCRLRESLGT
jgi:hypothetical protein